ncbi:MAG: hypothetical protein ACWGPN_03350 [Gammaproteobacteria bacterium]
MLANERDESASDPLARLRLLAQVRASLEHLLENAAVRHVTVGLPGLIDLNAELLPDCARKQIGVEGIRIHERAIDIEHEQMTHDGSS